MSIIAFDPARLLTQLNKTGLQNEDNTLYQFLKQLIAAVNLININGTSGSGGGGGGGGGDTIIANIIQQISFGDEGGDDSLQIPGPAGSSFSAAVPYFIPAGETFTVPLYKQALFSMNIDNEGTVDIEGFLIEVD